MTTVERCHEGTDRLGRSAERPKGLEKGMRPLEFCQKNVTGGFGKCSSSKVKSRNEEPVSHPAVRSGQEPRSAASVFPLTQLAPRRTAGSAQARFQVIQKRTFM